MKMYLQLSRLAELRILCARFSPCRLAGGRVWWEGGAGVEGPRPPVCWLLMRDQEGLRELAAAVLAVGSSGIRDISYSV